MKRCTERKDESGRMLYENDVINYSEFGIRHNGKIFYDEKKMKWMLKPSPYDSKYGEYDLCDIFKYSDKVYYVGEATC